MSCGAPEKNKILPLSLTGCVKAFLVHFKLQLTPNFFHVQRLVAALSHCCINKSASFLQHKYRVRNKLRVFFVLLVLCWQTLQLVVNTGLWMHRTYAPALGPLGHRLSLPDVGFNDWRHWILRKSLIWKAHAFSFFVFGHASCRRPRCRGTVSHLWGAVLCLNATENLLSKLHFTGHAKIFSHSCYAWKGEHIVFP